MTALATIWSGANHVTVETPYHDAIVAQFKAIPGCKWDVASKTWQGPPEAVVEVIGTLKRAGVIVTSGEVCNPITIDASDFHSNQDLYQYQRAGVYRLQRCLKMRNAALLADDMGLGKSVQTLRAVMGELRAPVLVLSPAIMVHKWLEEAKRWNDWEGDVLGRKLPKKQGGGRVLAHERLLVGSYDTFRTLVKDLPEVPTLVLDELHYLSSPKALRTRAVKSYIARCRARYPWFAVVGLTGTPMTARPRDLWQPLDLLYPGRFGTKWAFERRYCDGKMVEVRGLEEPVWDASGRSNLEELGRRLRYDNLMIRRTKGEVLELPAYQRITLPVELPAKARKALAAATVSLSADRDVQRVLSVIEEHKLNAALELADDLRQQGRRPLLFTLRKETARQLGAKLGAPVVTGEDEPGTRAARLKGAECGVATIYSVTTGIDLVGFDCAIFVGLDWVPSTLLQAEARLHRIGQECGVTFYYLIGLGTLDEVVRAKVIERLEDFATVVGKAENETGLASALRGAKSEEELLAEIVEAA